MTRWACPQCNQLGLWVESGHAYTVIDLDRSMFSDLDFAPDRERCFDIVKDRLSEMFPGLQVTVTELGTGSHGDMAEEALLALEDAWDWIEEAANDDR